MPNIETKICQNCKKEFTIEPDDFGFYEKISVPPPTWCPECRMIRRFVFRNVRQLFRRKDAKTGNTIFSSFHPAVNTQVFEVDFWNSDGWDPLEYGREYDFSRTFFDQFRELLSVVPLPSRGVSNLVNSDYCANASNLKNCYLCFDSGYLENCGYLITSEGTKDSFDLYQTRHAELSYEGYMVDESYRAQYCVNVEDCSEIWFSKNLIGCQNCFGCVNLRNKNYHIFNQPYSKEAYREFMAKFASDSHIAIEAMKVKVHAFWLKYPMRFTLGINNTNCTGEHIEHSKNVRDSFMVHEGENLKYCQILGGPVADSYDYTSWGEHSSLMYESLQVGTSCERMKFSNACWPGSSNIEYSMHCRSSSNLFGCVGLKKKQYCIFNRQYSKEEYQALRKKIIDHMNAMPYVDSRGNSYKYGEFFPPEFSPFAYNETITQDFFPLTKSEAEAKGFLWREPERKEYETTLTATEIPDSIKDVQDSILKEIIECATCGKAYRVIEMELAFLRRMNLPIPRKCVECRFKDRFQFVNPPKFWHARCECAGKADGRKIYTNAVAHFHGENPCPNEFETSYSPDKKEIVYCEKCYQNEVV